MAIDPNQFAGDPAPLQMQPAPKEAEGDGSVPSTYSAWSFSPSRLLKMHPGAGFTAPPEGVDISVPPEPPPPPSEIANVDDPTSGGGEPGAPAAGGPPVNVDVPYVTQSGEILSCTMGNWQGEPTAYDYVWKLDGAPVGGYAADYTTTAGDVGKVATCDVTAHNAAGSTPAPTSNAVTVA